MEMETIDKLCCNCIHYLHGQLENPCAKGAKSVGYLKEGCWRWQTDKEEEKEMPTMYCPECQQYLGIDKFYKIKGKCQPICRKCLPWKERRQKVAKQD